MTATVPAQKGSHWIPRAERHDTALEVAFHGPTVPAFKGHVRNVSASGMLIDTPRRMTVGDVLTASMPHIGDILCRIERVTARGAGVRFLAEVDEAAAARW